MYRTAEDLGFLLIPSPPDTAANNWVLGYWVVGYLAQQNYTGQNL